MASRGKATALADRFQRALVVDDSAGVRRLLVRAASDWAAQVVEAGTLKRALELATRETDLVITDIKLEDGNTSGLLAELARRDPTPLLIAISGRLSASETFELAHLGVHAFVAKPFGLMELADHVNRALERRATGQARSSEAAAVSIGDAERSLAAFAKTRGLSAQQIELLRIVLRGKTRRQLAHALGISENTCKTIVRRLLQRCGARRLADVVGALIGQSNPDASRPRSPRRGDVQTFS